MSKKFLIVAILCLTVWSILGLSCTENGETPIQHLRDIPVGFDGPHIQNIGSHSATVIFETTIPIVCNIAYGEDTDYGRLSLMAMTGPLMDHELELVGLKPSTTYHFRVTVTDLSSNVYQSENLTFTTIKGEEGHAPSGVNVLASDEGAHVVAVSSNWGGGDLDSSFGGNKGIDGDPNTAWSSDGDGDEAWIEIELMQSYELNTLGFRTRTMGNNAQIFSFEVLVNDEQRFGPFNLPDASTIYYFEVQVEAKQLRFEVVSSSEGNTGAVEIEAYSIQN